MAAVACDRRRGEECPDTLSEIGDRRAYADFSRESDSPGLAIDSAAAVAQEETLALFSERLKDVDRDALHERVLKFMRKSRPGREPDLEEIERAVRG